MRVAFLTHEPFYPPSGGGSAEAVYLVSEFVRRGHSVHVFGPHLPNAAEVERSLGIHLHGFRGWAMGRYTSLRTPKYLAYPFALEPLVRQTETPPLDLLFSQHAISAVAAARQRRRLRIPAVMNFLDCLTGFLETWPPYLMPKSVARALVEFELSIPRRSHAEAVLTVSDALRDRFVASGAAPETVHPIYYGFDARLFVRRPDDPQPDPSKPVIVMHGSFDHHHLGAIARNAVIDLARRRPSLRFRFVGKETPALRIFLETIRRQVPSLQTETPGFVPYDSIARHLADASVGITPYELSTGTHCAFVAKTIEYLALGLPVVSTPLESATRYYAGLEGISFSDTQGSTFADCVLKYLDTNAIQRKQLVEPARRKVIEELDWSRLCAHAVDVAEQVFQARPAN